MMAETGKGFRCYLLALGLSAAGAAEADWQWINPQPQGNLLADVVNDGSGQFVAVGNSGTILTSPDGTAGTWTLQESGTNEWLYAVEWVGGSKYITVGDSRTVLTGSGDAWNSQQTPGPYTFLYGVANEGNTYVAVGSNGSILYSTDGGVTWSDSVNVPWTADSRPWLNDVTRANGEFVAVGADGTIITSPNGVDWTAAALDTPSSLESVAWNGSDLLVAVGTAVNGASNAYVSDGGPWTPTSTGSATPLNGVHWDADSARFIVVGDQGEILTFDGQTWNGVSSGSQLRLEKAGSDNAGTLVAVGDFGTILRSTDQGQSWSPVTEGTRQAIRGVAISDSRYVAVGEGGIILTGTVGEAPLIAVDASSGAETLNDVAWNGRFIAVGAGGTILGSSDGSTWDPVASVTGADLSGITSTDGGWTAVGSGGTVLTSTDGAQWTARASGVTETLADVAASGGVQVAVGSGGTVITSSDGGETWNAVAAAQNVDLSAITATDAGWVAVGRNTDPDLTDDQGTVLTSPNGTDWTVQAADIAEPLQDVVWSGDTIYAAGGDSAPRRKEGLLLVSTDGAQSWARQSATGNDLLGLGVRGNTFMAVGDGGTVLESRCPCATDDTARTEEGVSVTIDVLANDIPGSDGAPLSILAFDERNGAISDNGDGTLTYTPPDGFTGVDTFGYTVGDGNGGRDVGTVTVTVDQAPYVPGSGGGSGDGSSGSGGGGGGGPMGGFMLLGLWGLLLARSRKAW